MFIFTFCWFLSEKRILDLIVYDECVNSIVYDVALEDYFYKGLYYGTVWNIKRKHFEDNQNTNNHWMLGRMSANNWLRNYWEYWRNQKWKIRFLLLSFAWNRYKWFQDEWGQGFYKSYYTASLSGKLGSDSFFRSFCCPFFAECISENIDISIFKIHLFQYSSWKFPAISMKVQLRSAQKKILE